MEQKKKSNTGKYILIGLGVVAIAGGAIYFATRKKPSSDLSDFDTAFDPSSALPEPSGSSGGSSSSGFPLKKGSRGDLVVNLQEALISKYGSSILPKYGADGIWGTELQNALISKGLPTMVTADDFTKIVTSSGSGSTSTSSKKKFNPSLLASNIRLAILDDEFDKALRSLSKIYTVNGYTMVNNYFKEKRIGGVRKTLVNALLSHFPKSSQKKKLNEHFYRIGLKYNGSQWSLSGVGQILCDQIKSLREIPVWNSCGKKIRVPKDTILGEFIDAKNGVTKFKTLDDKILYTNTKCICYV